MMYAIKSLTVFFLMATASCVNKAAVSSRSQQDDKLITSLVYHHNTSVSVILDGLAKANNIDKKIETERVAPAPNYWTPLCFASFIGNAQAVEWLIEKGADINYKDANGKTPLILAATAGSTEAIDILLHAGANIDEIDTNSNSALIHAAAEGNFLTVKYLVENGCELVPKKSMNALDFAIYYHHQNIIDYLRNKGLQTTNSL